MERTGGPVGGSCADTDEWSVIGQLGPGVTRPNRSHYTLHSRSEIKFVIV